MYNYFTSRLTLWLSAGIFFELLAFHCKYKVINFHFIYFFGHAFPVLPLVMIFFSILFFIGFNLLFRWWLPYVQLEWLSYPKGYKQVFFLYCVYVVLLIIFIIII